MKSFRHPLTGELFAEEQARSRLEELFEPHGEEPSMLAIKQAALRFLLAGEPRGESPSGGGLSDDHA